MKQKQTEKRGRKQNREVNEEEKVEKWESINLRGFHTAEYNFQEQMRRVVTNYEWQTEVDL